MKHIYPTILICLLAALILAGCYIKASTDPTIEPESQTVQTQAPTPETETPADETEDTEAETPEAAETEEPVVVETERTDTDSSGKPDSLRPEPEITVDPVSVYPKNPAFTEDNLLLTADQIRARNELTAADAGSAIRDMEQFLLTVNEISGVMVDARILSYKVPSTALYGNQANDASVRAMLEAKTNRGAITNTIAPRYGIILSNCDVRAFPDDTPMTDGPGGFDMLQESMFDLGEVVMIGHETADGAWFFAYGTNYFGWIRADHVKLCSLSEALDQLRCETFVMTVKQYTLPVSGRIARIGTKLPVSSYREEENGSEGFYSVLLPDGIVEEIPESFVSLGYIPFNTENLLTVYRNSLGQPYGWGDTDEMMDCTSLIGHVYRCFGIYVPRNSSAFRYTGGGSVYDVSQWSPDQKEQFILNSRPGTILIVPGHAMTYIGSVDGTPSILHMVTRVRENGVMREAQSCVISPLHGSGGSQASFLERMNWIIAMP